MTLSDILASEVVVDLDEWLEVWRPTIKKATENLDEWLGFVNRRAYKNQAGLDGYLKKLTRMLMHWVERKRTCMKTCSLFLVGVVKWKDTVSH